MANKKDAVERASELLALPMNQIPDMAFEYMRKMSKVYGGCTEVCLTAFAHYAQLEEGLPCNNPLYIPTEEDKEMFSAFKAAYGH